MSQLTIQPSSFPQLGLRAYPLGTERGTEIDDTLYTLIRGKRNRKKGNIVMSQPKLNIGPRWSSAGYSGTLFNDLLRTKERIMLWFMWQRFSIFILVHHSARKWEIIQLVLLDVLSHFSFVYAAIDDRILSCSRYDWCYELHPAGYLIIGGSCLSASNIISLHDT